MRDDLSRIESNYGSVAEYNRCRNENEAEEYWSSLSKEEQDKRLNESRRKHEEYMEEIQALEIEPSDLAKRLHAAYETASLQYKDDYYESRRFYQKYLKDSMTQIAEKYGKMFRENAWRFGESEPGKFSVSYEYEDITICHAVIDNLTKDEFMQIYADMGEIARYNRFPTYRDTKEHEPDIFGRVDDKHFVSNTSLGELRRNEFDRWGVPNEDAHDILQKVRNDRESRAAELITNVNHTEEFNNNLEIFC